MTMEANIEIKCLAQRDENLGLFYMNICDVEITEEKSSFI